jgi:predicted TIM-barrel fold metal-dependent hydrolase
MRDALLRGEHPPGLVVVDAHAHLGGVPNFTVPRSGAEDVVRTMDAAGIDVAWIAPLLGCGPDYRGGNREMAEAVRRHPDRFRGLVVVNPNDPAGLRDELARYAEADGVADGVAGIKVHPGFHGYPLTGPAYRPVWAFAHERGLPVLLHTWGGTSTSAPSLVHRIAGEYPRARFLLGHAGGTWAGHLEAIEVAQRWPNVYLETCTSRSPFGAVEWLVREVGAARVVFGTDQPFVDPRPQLGRVAFAKLPDADKALILGGNARRLLARGAAPAPSTRGRQDS